ncbi:hypothetical protein MOQ_008847 [Trypanosoma cruzi marinkellei]|uniref:Uncharacterized protein n=1 Tax=Trypanosoma cruzi marinkellei TaxID=85056 RepID=K2MP50_TRYCR|nr:hypothetical protein MOQ_008847 [Trypanosoma cruzi marinkellei]
MHSGEGVSSAMLLGNDSFTREFLVHVSIQDKAPQRLQLKVQNPLSAEDMLRQIGRQLVEPTDFFSENVTLRRVVPDSHLFAFSAEENCFVPVDGKPAAVLKNFAHLLVHPLSVLPQLGSTAVAPWRHLRNSGTRCVSAPPLNGDASQTKRSPQQRVQFRVLESLSAGKRQCGALGQDDFSALPPAEDSLTQPRNERDGLDEAQRRRKLSVTLEVMLKVMGHLLSEYSSRASEDVIEPTEKSLWNLIEDASCRSGGVPAPSLDSVTVDAFVETIISSIHRGRMHRNLDCSTHSRSSARNM